MFYNKDPELKEKMWETPQASIYKKHWPYS